MVDCLGLAAALPAGRVALVSVCDTHTWVSSRRFSAMIAHSSAHYEQPHLGALVLCQFAILVHRLVVGASAPSKRTQVRTTNGLLIQCQSGVARVVAAHLLADEPAEAAV